MSENQFSEVLEQIPYAVSVVTLGAGGLENGLTISWLSQISAKPPMLAFSIHKDHYSRDRLADHPHFVVNLLAEDQKDLAGHFAKASMVGEDKIDKFPTQPGRNEVPILSEALAYFDCDVHATHEVGDHVLIVGLIINAGKLRDAAPMTSASGLRYRP
ncbi:MAG: flavin reductase [Deltaproteobacteria bacterium]|nr:flavin reductase [Deltaproteobacteria bacterium]